MDNIAQTWEIIRNEDYGISLPNGTLRPKDGDAELNELIVRVKAVLKELQVSNTAQFDGELVSTEFRSGFVDGFGWRIGKEEVANALGIPETKYTAEFDNIIIRGAMRVFELIVSQMLGENDNRIFTAMMEVDHYDPMTGKVWLDTRNGKLYNPFRVGDYIMVQQYNGMPSEENQHYITKHYECIITGVGIGSAEDGENRLDWVTFKNFVSPTNDSAANIIGKGDTFCRVDNETDEDRKGIIQIMTVGSATPYMDIVRGLKTDPDNALKGRLGNLQGIYHHLFGQLQGFGELLMNLYAVGDFRLSQTGESVQARFEMLKNVFATRFTKQTNEVTEADNFLTNGTFGENMEGWTPNPEEDTRFLTLADGTPILVNDTTQTTAQHRIGIDEYDGKQMLHIINSGITQANALIKQPGTHKEYVAATAEDETTQQKYDEVQDTMFISIRMLSKRTDAFDTYNSALSTISTAIENANKAIQDYLKTYGEQLKQEAINYANSINVAETYEQSTNPCNTWTGGTEYKHIGAMWKYTGSDDGVTIYNRNGNKIDAINGHTYRYVGWTGNYWEDVSDVASTIAFWNNYGDVLMGAATNFDADGNITQQGGQRISAFGNTLWVKDGDLISKITQYANGICLSALNITLNGYISNGNGSFAVDENGNVSMQDALINGTLRSPFVNASSYVTNPWSTSGTISAPCAKDNVYYQTSGSITLNWNTKDSGRRITVIHGKNYATAYCEITAPSGYYFWENGKSKSSIKISRQMCVLKGYGDESSFYGYIVELRQDINTVCTYGAPMKTICQGKVTVKPVTSGSTPSVSLTVSCYDKTSVSSFSITRSGTGIYKLYLPGTWYIYPLDIFVQATGFGLALDSATAYASTIVFCNVTSIGTTTRYNPNIAATETYVQYIEFRTADDSSLNDGSFYFQINNMADLDWL